MKGRKCHIVATGKKNSIMIEFENGQREIISRFAIRKITFSMIDNIIIKPLASGSTNKC